MTSEFVCMDWDLQAIVRGCNVDGGASATSIIMDEPPSCFPPLSLQQDAPLKFPNISETTTILTELDELYKPFYPQTRLNTSSISVPDEVKKPEKLIKQQSLSGSSTGTSVTDQAARPRRGRKNQHKREVKMVTVDGLSSDLWAWRKYGQKPIKGSPYPRSYYRCSSSKGCLARKHVERSSRDPSMFIITYSADHNHGQPARRSSLSGSTRNNKYSMPRTPAATNGHTYQQGDQSLHQKSIKKEDQHVSKDNEYTMADLLLNDEMFSSLEDLEGLLLDQFPDNTMSLKL